jgi:hypothetical protein
VAFVVGGFVIVTVVGIIALVVIRDAGLSHLGRHQARYGLRLGIGVLAMIAAVLIYLHKRKPPDLAKEEKRIKREQDKPKMLSSSSECPPTRGRRPPSRSVW